MFNVDIFQMTLVEFNSAMKILKINPTPYETPASRNVHFITANIDFLKIDVFSKKIASITRVNKIKERLLPLNTASRENGDAGNNQGKKKLISVFRRRNKSALLKRWKNINLRIQFPVELRNVVIFDILTLNAYP